MAEDKHYNNTKINQISDDIMIFNGLDDKYRSNSFRIYSSINLNLVETNEP